MGGTLMGAYTVVEETETLTHIILAAGSEVSLAVDAAKEGGGGCRVVSMPNKAITTAVEAGVSSVWYKYADKVVGVDSFGESAPAKFVFEAKGITVPNVVATLKA